MKTSVESVRALWPCLIAWAFLGWLAGHLTAADVSKSEISDLKSPINGPARTNDAAVMPFGREPLDATSNPYWQEHVNRDRIYDFYAKQARHYRRMDAAQVPEILPAFPGIDGGRPGHWGNQNDQETWKDGRVRQMDHGSMVSGVFRGAGRTIPRGVSVSLGDGFNAVFNQDTLRFEAAWKGGLVRWSDVRHGLMHGIPMGGDETVQLGNLEPPASDAKYLGLYRQEKRVIFASLEGGQRKYRTLSAHDGRVVESLVAEPEPARAQWPERITTRGELGAGQPYAIDTLTLPYENPWKALFFPGGVDFVSARRIAICTIHGDVWICDVLKDDLSVLSWKRFAAGLHQPLGLKVVGGLIHVMCRDQIVALHDRNRDDEADFYECVSNVHQTSTDGHDFITGLERDDRGRWYFASGNQGLCRVAGGTLEVLATGLRNPNGLGVTPDGSVVLSTPQEGNWTPSSAICDASQRGHFGAGGPRPGDRGYVRPMLYVPRGVDNSSGGPIYIDSGQWGPVQGHWIHLATGFATHFLVLRETIGGESQGAAVPLWGEFLSGGHRGRFSPYDGQLYVAGAQGWGNYGMKDGALQRVRFTKRPFPYPIKFESRDNGLMLTFSEPQSAEIADARFWFAQQWSYRYGPAYGSPEFSVTHPGIEGHDRVEIRSVHRLGDGTRVFIELPQLQPVDQLHLHFDGARRVELFATLHRLGPPFTGYAGYVQIPKTTRSAVATTTDLIENLDPRVLMTACTSCHHPTQRVIGPPFSEIRQRYTNNPEGIVKFAMKPENKNFDPNSNLPPMPSFDFLGEKNLRIIADQILSPSKISEGAD